MIAGAPANRTMSAPFIEINAYAIVSADDRITDASGDLPPELMNEADWRYFQDELDRCDFTLVGRLSHEAAPNRRKRKRIIMSSRVVGLEKRADGWWWNARNREWASVAAELLPTGGRVGVPGGQAVFDLMLPLFTAFHLSRARRATLPGGRGLFESVERGETAESVLRDAGFVAEPTLTIDEAAAVDLTVWRRAQKKEEGSQTESADDC